MQTLGIIGGLGPQTTANLYLRVQKLVDPKLTGSRPPIIINSVPITSRLERENILYEREFEPVLPYLVEAGKSLENAGADFLVLACNSLHIFEKQISENIDVPFLSMVDVTVDYIVSKDIKKVGLLGTYKTKSSGMYTVALESKGIKTIQTSEEEQKLLGESIIRLIEGSYGPEDQVLLKNLVMSLAEQGASKVILACTDLHLVVDFEDTAMASLIVDSMDILAQRSAERIMT
jgi:aspartate racemase